MQKENLTYHVLSKHENLRPYQCTDCSYAGVTKYLLTYHVRRVHQGIRRPRLWRKDAKFSCVRCPYQTMQRKRFEDHLEDAHGEDVRGGPEVPPDPDEPGEVDVPEKEENMDEDEIYRCQSCKFGTGSESEFLKHYEKFHKSSNIKKEHQDGPDPENNPEPVQSELKETPQAEEANLIKHPFLVQVFKGETRKDPLDKAEWDRMEGKLYSVIAEMMEKSDENSNICNNANVLDMGYDSDHACGFLVCHAEDDIPFWKAMLSRLGGCRGWARAKPDKVVVHADFPKTLDALDFPPERIALILGKMNPLSLVVDRVRNHLDGSRTLAFVVSQEGHRQIEVSGFKLKFIGRKITFKNGGISEQ